MPVRVRIASALAAAALAGPVALVPIASASAAEGSRPPSGPTGASYAANAPAVGFRASADARAERLASSRRPVPGARPDGHGGTGLVRPPVTLPAALDVQAGYAGQTSCDPTDKPGSVAFGQLLKTVYPRGVVGISRSCTEAGTSEHKDGRAVDFMINAKDPAQKAVGDAIVGWITANNGEIARRLGVMYLIWDGKFWGGYAPQDGWIPYTGSNPHTDHIHTSLTWDGAMARTSWWTGKAITAWDRGPCRPAAGEYAPIYTGPRTAPCPTPLAGRRTTHATMVLGSSGPEVAAAQRLLVGSATGRFDYGFWTVVRAWQQRKGLPVTGVLDQATWAVLDPASVR